MSKGRDKSYNARRWFKVYRQRIVDGLETCRACGRGDDPRNWLTFDHVIPSALGRNMTFDNATILCEDCNEDKADRVWPHLVSLAAEESAAPRQRRWFLLAEVAAFRACGTEQIARRGVDGSAVTIVNSGLPWGARCIACPLRADGKHERFGLDLALLLRHLDEHRRVGQHVPDWVDEDVRTAISAPREAS